LLGSTGGSIISVTTDNCDGDVDDRCVAEKGHTVRGQVIVERM
jgi:hypothetical protein